MRKIMKRIGMVALAISALMIVLPAVSYADPDPATMNAQQVNSEIANLNTQQQTVEGQIQQIADSPAQPGESLDQEIARKSRETRELRKRLEAIRARLQTLDARKRQLQAATPVVPAAPPPAVSTGPATEYAPITDQDAASRPWQVASGQRDPLWGHGTNPRPGSKPEGAQSEDNDHTVWVHSDYSSPSRLTSDPNDRGWWIDGNGRIRNSMYHARSTRCQPCVWLVNAFNEKMKSLIFRRGELEQERREKDGVLQFERRYMEEHRASGVSDIDFAGQVGQRLQEVSAAFDAKIAASQRELDQLERDMKELAAQIAVCEQQCGPGTQKTGITLGGFGGWVPARPGTLNPDLVLPIRWEGPYYTQCDPCKEIAKSLNNLPSGLWYILEEIYRKKLILISAEASAAFHNLFAGRDYGDGFGPSKTVNAEEWARRLRQEIASLQREAALKVLEFHRLKEELAKCEREKCPDLRHGMLVLPGQDGEYALVSADLEYTVSISGTNPFDPYEIERIPGMVQNTEMGGTGTFVPTTPVTPTIPTTPTTPPTPTTPTTPTSQPLVVTTSGTIAFSHTVGSSPCPQPAGTVAISSNNNNPLSVSGISVSGDLSSRLNTNVNNNASAVPQVSAQFNCSSPANGNYTGTLTGTVTDTVTGETSTFSVPATGNVSG